MTRKRRSQPDPISRKLKWFLQGLSVCMFIAAIVIAHLAGVDTYPDPVRIDVGLPAWTTGLAMFGTFLTSEKSKMIKWVCLGVGLVALTLLLFMLHELLPSLGQSS